MRFNLTRGTSATFTMSEVLCPDVREVLQQIGPELTVTGEVMYLSDGGQEKDKFAVIRVAGIAAPLIVPTERLRPCNSKTDTECDSNGRHNNTVWSMKAKPG